MFPGNQYKRIHTVREARQGLAAKLALSSADLADLLPSGRQTKFTNRVAWAKVYLQRAGPLASPRRGSLQITARGIEVLGEGRTSIDVSYLQKFPEFVAFTKRKNSKGPGKQIVEQDHVAPATPQEQLENACQQITADLAHQLLERVLDNPPEFFEQLVIDLLLAMGYGGSREAAGRAIGKSGDEGIDGVVQEDRLGLDLIYLQAKRWKGVVGRPELQRFVGALHGKRARRGVFITTGTFSSGASEYAKSIEANVVLIDGVELAELMIEYDVGVTTRQVHKVKALDADYFEET